MKLSDILHRRSTGQASGQHKERRGHGFHSLKFEFTALFFALIGGAILLILVLNTFFLGRYYINQRELAFSNAYEQLDKAAENNAISSDAFDVELLRITSKDNIACIVMDQESQTVKCYASDPDTMMRRMWDNLLDATNDLPENFTQEDAARWAAPDQNESSDTNGSQADRAAASGSSAGNSASGEGASAGSSGGSQPDIPDFEDYFIVSERRTSDGQRVQVVLDRRTNTRYLEMFGMLEDGSYYLLRSAMENIRSNAVIADRFIAYVGLVVIAVGLVVALVLGNRITRPMRQLNAVSKRMRALDFTARYEGNDKTEIGELGENLNELSSTLQKTISELKTANLELKNDLKKREQIEKTQQEFISNVTHELKTPIALIQGYAEGLQDGITDDKESQDFYTGVIIDEAGKMNQMVQKLLQLMHLEFGQLDVNMVQFDIVEVIRNYLSSADLLSKNKDVRLRFSYNGKTDLALNDIPPIMVWADEFLTEEVFQNYFTNALNHAEGDKIIDIRFLQMQNVVRISVFNTGKPIPAESLPRIWEKFYKVDKARTREYGGSGVGLSIVKAIMELMHQQYGAVNYDNGVEFWFELDTKSTGQ